ncbi:hypothetical protein [Pedobacter agri]|uniref:hypothetical protein n=1 Tax=Pedobacter agri TaxID=454586 RepID=UPI0029316A52|nr:hypothetical protein [Pedobacter agri]
MKPRFLFLLMILGSGKLLAQIYVDPTTSAAMATQSVMINSQLSSTGEKLTLLQRAQLAVSAELGIANELQNRIFRGLSEVSSAVSSLLAVADIYDITQDIIRDGQKAISVAGKNPALLLFAQSGAEEFQARALRLSAQVSSFVLHGSKDNLMDSGERAKLLGKIVTELSIIRGVVYGIYRVMYWASIRGFWNSINPYAGYINLDKRIADEVLSKSKLLKR